MYKSSYVIHFRSSTTVAVLTSHIICWYKSKSACILRTCAYDRLLHSLTCTTNTRDISPPQ